MRAGYRGLPSWKRPDNRRRRRAVLVAALATAAGLLLPFLAKPAARLLGAVPLFRAGSIEITGLLYLSPEEVRARIPVREDENLFTIDTERVAESLRGHPRIEAVRVSRALGTLRVEIRERRTFLLANAGALLELDASGTILSPLARGLVADRPVLSGVPFPTVKPGARVTTARLKDVLRLVALLESPQVGLVSEISEIVSEDRNRAVLRTSRDQIPIVVDPERVTLTALRALSAALKHARGGERRVLGVDTRYREQIVVRCSPDSVQTAAVVARAGA